MSEIRVGPAGWSYPDWDGVVYPSPRPRGFDCLRHISRFFDLVEINSTFYRPVEPSTASSWVRRVSANPRFLFTAKLWQGFTHRPAKPHAAEERRFKEGLRPIAEAGRLACVLVQFPHSFRPSPETRAHLASLAERFGDTPLAVELRRADWASPETIAWLKEKKIAFCNLDQPLIGRGGGATIAPTAHVTAPHAYVRLHGRNRDAWFDEKAGRDDRYDYLYDPAEVEEWVGRIRSMAASAEQIHVIANNHFRGKAVVNALMIRAMLQGEAVDAPQGLAERYSSLAPFARAGEQGRLF